MSKKTLRTILQLVIFTIIGVGIVWYMYAQLTPKDRQETILAIRSTNLLLLVPVLFANLLSVWARARRWQLLLDPIGIHPTTTNTLFAVFIGYIVNLIPPRAGEVAKCTVLARYENMPADKMIGTIVVERIWDVICLMIVVGIGIAWQGDVVLSFFRSALKGHVPSGPKVIAYIITLLLFIVLLVGIYRRNRDSKIGKFIKGLGDGISSIIRLRKKGWFLSYTVLIWFLYVLQVQLGLWAMPATQHLGFGAALISLLGGSLALIITPGGVGLYPLMVAKVLRRGYGISPPDALALGLVSWITLTVITLINGFASLILLPFYNRKPHDAQAPVDNQQGI